MIGRWPAGYNAGQAGGCEWGAVTILASLVTQFVSICSEFSSGAGDPFVYFCVYTLTLVSGAW